LQRGFLCLAIIIRVVVVEGIVGQVAEADGDVVVVLRPAKGAPRASQRLVGHILALRVGAIALLLADCSHQLTSDLFHTVGTGVYDVTEVCLPVCSDES